MFTVSPKRQLKTPVWKFKRYLNFSMSPKVYTQLNDLSSLLPWI